MQPTWISKRQDPLPKGVLRPRVLRDLGGHAIRGEVLSWMKILFKKKKNPSNYFRSCLRSLEEHLRDLCWALCCLKSTLKLYGKSDGRCSGKLYLPLCKHAV